jgi:hypothetical protein
LQCPDVYSLFFPLLVLFSLGLGFGLGLGDRLGFLLVSFSGRCIKYAMSRVFVWYIHSGFFFWLAISVLSSSS